MPQIALPNAIGLRTLWLVRWVVGLLLLAAGLIVLSGPMPTVSWFQLQVYSQSLELPLPTRLFFVGLVSTTFMAATLLSWPTCRDEARRILAEAVPCKTGWLLWLVVYVSAVAGLTIFATGSIHARPSNLLRGLADVFLIASALVGWSLATMPTTFWSAWLRRNRKLFPALMAVAIFAFPLAHHYTPLAVGHLSSFTGPVQLATLWACARLLHLLVSSVIFDPSTGLIGTAAFSVYVDTPCIGWEGIATFGMFFGLYLWICRADLRFPHILIMIPIGATALWALNIVRIVALILLGGESEYLAIGVFHSLAGWLLFDAVTLAVVAVSARLAFFRRDVPTSVIGQANPVSPFLVPFIVLAGTAMLMQSVSRRIDVLYPISIGAAAATLLLYWRKLSLRWRPSWSALALGAAGFLAVIVLGRYRAVDPSLSSALKSLSYGELILWVLSRTAGAVLVVPIAQELALRGYLMRRLVATEFETVSPGTFTLMSFLVSSVLFGALQDQWVVGTLLGMLFAAAIYRHGQLSDGIVAHSVTNLLLSGHLLATGHWVAL